jgi:hypothetical protein
VREAFALARLGWSRHTRFLLTSLVIVFIGQILFWVLWVTHCPRYLIEFVQSFVLIAGLLGVFFIANWTESRSDSKISSWLLRQPLTTTQIVFPIVVCKTVWVAVFWISFLVPIGYFSPSESASEPALLPVIFGFVGFVLLFFAVAWRPYASPLQSLIVGVGAIVLFFTVLLGTAYATDDGRPLYSCKSLAWQMSTTCFKLQEFDRFRATARHRSGSLLWSSPRDASHGGAWLRFRRMHREPHWAIRDSIGKHFKARTTDIDCTTLVRSDWLDSAVVEHADLCLSLFRDRDSVCDLVPRSASKTRAVEFGNTSRFLEYLFCVDRSL